MCRFIEETLGMPILNCLTWFTGGVLFGATAREQSLQIGAAVPAYALSHMLECKVKLKP